MAAGSEWFGAMASTDSSLELALQRCLAVTAAAHELEWPPGQAPGYTLRAPPGAEPFGAGPEASAAQYPAATPGCKT